MSKVRIKKTPFAVGVDGSLLLNLASQLASDDLPKILEAARNQPDDVFIGISLRGSERSKFLKRLDNASAEAAALLAGHGKQVEVTAASERRPRATSTHKRSPRAERKSRS